MSKSILKTILSIMCLIVLLLFIGSLIFRYPLDNTEAKDLENKNVPVESSISSSEVIDKVYTVKEYQSNIGIFENQNIKPSRIIDVEFSALPLEDQKLLSEGIQVSSENELKRLIQDFGS